MARLFGVAVVGVLIALLVGAGAAFALSNDGTVTVVYSGSVDQSFVYQADHPAVEHGTMKLGWDETETFALSGEAEHRLTLKVLTRALSVSGTVMDTFAAPNQNSSCSGSLSARPGGPDPLSVEANGAPLSLRVSTIAPRTGANVQSSAPASLYCASPVNGSPGFEVPDAALADEQSVNPAVAIVLVHSQPFSKHYTAKGSDSNVTETFDAELQVKVTCASGGSPAATATAAPMSCCPDPADDPLLGEATEHAHRLQYDEFQGNGLGKDGLAESALHNIHLLGHHLRREFPLRTDQDRAERKRLINAGARVADAQIMRAYDDVKRKLDEAEAADVARAKCPDIKQKIRDIYRKQLGLIDDENAGDHKYVSNEVVGTVNLFCGCHLSTDARSRLPIRRHSRQAHSLLPAEHRRRDALTCCLLPDRRLLDGV